MPPTRKYGTSAPSRAPMRVSVARSRSSFHSLFSASSVIAAFGAAAAETGFRRHALAQIDRDVARRRALAGAHAMQQRRRLPHEVAPIGRDVGLVAGDGERPAPRGHRHVVEQRQRLKHGLEIVEAVGTRSEDTQVEIDLRERRQTDGSQGSSRSKVPACQGPSSDEFFRPAAQSIAIRQASSDRRRMVHQPSMRVD